MKCTTWNLMALGILSMSLTLTGCGKENSGTSGGNNVSLQIGSTLASSWTDFFVSPAYAAVGEVRLCFKRLRFKTEGEETDSDPTLDDDNVDFAVGEVSLTGAATPLGDISIPAGTYTRIEFDLEKDCNGYSVYVDNDNGTYQTDSRITVKFEGNFLVAADLTQTITLGVENIVTALDSVTADNEIRTQAESVSGTY